MFFNAFTSPEYVGSFSRNYNAVLSRPGECVARALIFACGAVNARDQVGRESKRCRYTVTEVPRYAANRNIGCDFKLRLVILADARKLEPQIRGVGADHLIKAQAVFTNKRRVVEIRGILHLQVYSEKVGSCEPMVNRLPDRCGVSERPGIHGVEVIEVLTSVCAEFNQVVFTCWLRSKHGFWTR